MVKQIKAPEEEEVDDPLSQFTRWWSKTVAGDEEQHTQMHIADDVEGPPVDDEGQYIPKTESEDFYVPEPTTIEPRRIASVRLDTVADDPKPKNVPAAFEKCGVGITFAFDDEENALRVMKLIEGKPADRSGMVNKGDLLEVVDGINVVGHPIEVVHDILKGREGTVARLVLRDANTLEEKSVALVREEVPEISHYFVPPKVGVGITFETSAVDGSARVKGVVRGSPADRSGLVRHGDVLYEVDGSNVFREGLDVVANFLLGEPGTPVQLLFLRGTRIFVQLTLKREAHARQSDMGDVLLFAQSSRRIIPPDVGAVPGEDPIPNIDSTLNNREPVTLHNHQRVLLSTMQE
mmetsp:Transcript_31238/g.73635  ORF Transcript_31238/g.73635 Transcript_31238/m.73635 type:complete len:350 (+) Transcript_31238:68-1117(+)